MSDIHGPDVVRAGFAERNIPTGWALAPSNEMYDGGGEWSRESDRSGVGVATAGLSIRQSFLDEPTIEEATRELSKRCIVDGCKGFHKANSQFCVGHARAKIHENVELPR